MRFSLFARPVGTEVLLAVAAAWFALAMNVPFLTRSAGTPVQWPLLLALVAGVWALHVLLMAPFATRHTAKGVVALFVLVAAFASYYIGRYGVYLDPTMLRNVLRTDWHEARELLSPALAFHLAWAAVLPLLLLWRVRLAPRGWRRAAGARVALVLLALAVLGAALFSAFQPLASLMRNHKELRYLVTPANALWSTARVVSSQFEQAAGPRLAIGTDAAPGPRMAARAQPGARPLVVVLVVGETARAANWGLSGYTRDTTPRLAQLPLVSFPYAEACGTNTETSLPCLFAPVGRRDYDERTIRRSESLLHVAARAGAAVHWRDNQSGCKGVCDGLSQELVIDAPPPGLCADGRCFDEALLAGLDARLDAVARAAGGAGQVLASGASGASGASAVPAASAASAVSSPSGAAARAGTTLLVLHMLGNHGPAYFKRYPDAFAVFRPECRSEDLARCSREEIVAAYDNALRYTDHVLAEAIATLSRHADRVDSALLFVSDHGESLGEGNLYLHGVPYAIAPKEQTRVPMFLWLSPGAAAAAGFDAGCLRARAAQPAAHDHVFHTLLGLLDVRSSVHDAAWDLTAACRGAAR